MGLLGGEVWLEKQTPPQKNLLTLTPRRKIPQSETEDKNLTDLLTNVFLKCIELYFEILNDKRAWWKGQPDVDRRPSWRFLLVDVDQTDVFLVDVEQTELFYWSTSTRLSFSTGRRRPDWGFLLVDVDQTEVFNRSTSWSTVDAVDARQRPFYWRFHHALIKSKI